MPTSSELERQLKKATKTGKYIVGRKEVRSSIKGSKLVIWSASANLSQEILDQCKGLEIPAMRFEGDPMALGKLCGIPFKVSIIAVRSPGDADLGSFSGAHDYSVHSSSHLGGIPVLKDVEEEKPGEAKKPASEKKSKPRKRPVTKQEKK